MTGAIGHLAVDLSIRGGRVKPRITLRPGLPIGRLLIGRTRAEAVIIVPAVLNLCASAHREAASAAVGLGGGGSGGGSRWETIRDHALAILRDWPACLGLAAGRDGLGELAALSAGRDRAGALTALRRRICGECSDLVRFEPSDLDRWLAKGETPTARLLAHVRRHFDPVWGRAALPAPTLGVIAAVASGDTATRCEVTCADRVRGEPLPAGVEALEGRSLFVRLLGRLADLLRCLDGHETGNLVASSGFGFAQASRGMLIHSVRLDGDTIIGYRIITPTDWNLAEGGLLHSMLATLPPDDRLEHAARLALACIDPCVPTTLTVRHA